MVGGPWYPTEAVVVVGGVGMCGLLDASMYLLTTCSMAASAPRRCSSATLSISSPTYDMKADTCLSRAVLGLTCCSTSFTKLSLIWVLALICGGEAYD